MLKFLKMYLLVLIVIGSDVELGSNTKLHSHININGNTKIGKNNEIFPLCINWNTSTRFKI